MIVVIPQRIYDADSYRVAYKATSTEFQKPSKPSRVSRPVKFEIYIPESTEEETRTGESPMIKFVAVAKEARAIYFLWLCPALRN